MAQNSPSQTQRLITALAASILVFYAWVFVYQRFIAKPVPATQPASAPAAISDTTTTQTSSAPAAATNVASPQAVTAPAGAGGLVLEEGRDITTITLGNAAHDSPFPMALELTPRGASVRNAWVRGYYETVKKEEPYRIFQPLPAEESAPERYSLTTTKIRFVDLDQEVQLDRAIWRIDSVTPEQVVFSVTVNRADGTPLARVLKTYTLQPQPPKPGTRGETYDVTLNTRIENLTSQPLQAVLVQQGPIGFQQESRTEDRKIIGAVYAKDSRQGPIVKGHLRSELEDKDLLELGRDEPESRIAWVAEANQYFTCIMAPEGRTSFDDPPRFERVDAIHLIDRKDAKSQDLTFRYVTTPMTVAAGGFRDVTFDTYIGPKSKQIFQSVPKYEQRDYYAVISESFYACAPAGLVALMMWLLNAFHKIPPHNYGIAIILLVIVVRGILHPITKRSQVNMMKMQKQMSALQPKINAVKEKYANDRAAMQQAMMQVYKDAGVNPAGSILTCIPMMLQLPIWAALWTALNSTVEMRHAPFDGWWIKDLTQPDSLIWLSDAGIHIPLIGFIMGGPVHAFNLLPVLLAASQLLQARFMPRGSTTPAPGGNPDQMEQQRKMMMFMSVFFLFMFYNMPSGLNLYIMTSNFAGILEQWRIRKHIAEEEERLKSLPPGTRPPETWLSRLLSPFRDWLSSKWEELQKEAEEVRKLQSAKPKKRK
ncbi:MAG TPA: membrane protein insertase YidC [Phycisphaerae bacterium]|nr:membrane protein insertase YidC [Phycisphaerae bacterium]HOJ72824.1 membrane protein insertase YidC [Phycisphaerae bacterium]HOM51749.1 membrane protein insertase YidC [Phycisphaerae bacterium]HON64999.1 membrane protein insertase YidC [Phycisphaerae bacterium]HOQ87673.1 membrane protein insertase YidC [Phycisphaerae bacterium]